MSGRPSIRRVYQATVQHPIRRMLRPIYWLGRDGIGEYRGLEIAGAPRFMVEIIIKEKAKENGGIDII